MARVEQVQGLNVIGGRMPAGGVYEIQSAEAGGAVVGIDQAEAVVTVSGAVVGIDQAEAVVTVSGAVVGIDQAEAVQAAGAVAAVDQAERIDASPSSGSLTPVDQVQSDEGDGAVVMVDQIQAVMDEDLFVMDGVATVGGSTLASVAGVFPVGAGLNVYGIGIQPGTMTAGSSLPLRRVFLTKPTTVASHGVFVFYP